jgi:hypothetical protein
MSQHRKRIRWAIPNVQMEVRMAGSVRVEGATGSRFRDHLVLSYVVRDRIKGGCQIVVNMQIPDREAC